MACADDLLVQPEISPPGIPQIPPEARKALEAAGTVGPILVAQPKGSSRVFVAFPADSVTPSTSRRLREAQHGGPDAHEEDLILIVNPSGPWAGGADSTQTVSWTAFCRTGPGDLIPMDMRVDSIVQVPIAGTGGHLFNHQGPKPRGSWAPPSGNSVATVFPTVYTARHASGDERIRFTYEITDPNAPPECRGTTVDTTFMNGVRYPSDGFEVVKSRQLIELVEGQDHIFLQDVTSDHTSVSYVVPEVAPLLYDLAEDFFLATDDSIRINAASLVYGGINDIPDPKRGKLLPNWEPPHKYHRIGTDLDLDTEITGDEERDALEAIRRAALANDFEECINEGDHVHCFFRNY